MRGKAIIPNKWHVACRITPAYAGKRSKKLPLNVIMWDHPRLCGEKQNPQFQLISFLGSPPPMRGKAEKDLAESELLRITPAYAGKSRKVLCPH